MTANPSLERETTHAVCMMTGGCNWLCGSDLEVMGSLSDCLQKGLPIVVDQENMADPSLHHCSH